MQDVLRNSSSYDDYDYGLDSVAIDSVAIDIDTAAIGDSASSAVYVVYDSTGVY